MAWEHFRGALPPTLVFRSRWGPKSWLVDYVGPYDNFRDGEEVPPHVELKSRVKQTGTCYDSKEPGSVYQLQNLRKSGLVVKWDVAGLSVAGGLAHFTVHYGQRAVEDFHMPRDYHRDYLGPFDNFYPPHVELRRWPHLEGTSYDSMVPWTVTTQ